MLPWIMAQRVHLVPGCPASVPRALLLTPDMPSQFLPWGPLFSLFHLPGRSYLTCGCLSPFNTQFKSTSSESPSLAPLFQSSTLAPYNHMAMTLGFLLPPSPMAQSFPSFPSPYQGSPSPPNPTVGRQ